MEQKSNFSGTYFDKDSVLRLELWVRIIAWLLLAAYFCESGYNIFQTIYSSQVNGFAIDIFFYISTFSRLLQGAMLFIVLQIIAKTVLILLDIEDNTRRAARLNGKEK